ncbi:hypothetical protein TARUN_7785 [Trichoderma arundinaceum]|uniref:Uncharacterized protein n=1 Tax=Trichoderma arundinaceum TaxID=490622 RepID=A0A395NEM0_TRIAR|nr:hypothetical protein TARUN_7785 [Trichoderma arundinaceum]
MRQSTRDIIVRSSARIPTKSVVLRFLKGQILAPYGWCSALRAWMCASEARAALAHAASTKVQARTACKGGSFFLLAGSARWLCSWPSRDTAAQGATATGIASARPASGMFGNWRRSYEPPAGQEQTETQCLLANVSGCDPMPWHSR